MCKSLEDGGMRCAAHTRPAYKQALITFETETRHGAGTISTAAINYAATPSGQNDVLEDASRLEDAGDIIGAEELRSYAKAGAEEYTLSRKRAEDIDQEIRRAESIRANRIIPESPEALKAYKELVKKELELTDEDFNLILASQESASTLDPAEVGQDSIIAARYIIENEAGNLVGTATDNGTLRTIADLETLTAAARRQKRASIEQVDENGRRWVKYENQDRSQVLQSVLYNEEENSLKVSLFAKGKSTDIRGPEYAYQGVSKSLFNALISARSMGRLYATVLSPTGDNGNLENATARDFSQAVHMANNMFPTGQGHRGPAPRRGHYLPAATRPTLNAV